jgi:arsenite methyltransferase
MAEQVTSNDDIREAVRDRYADAAKAAGQNGCGCGPSCGGEILPEEERQVFGASQYDDQDMPEEAALASLGCGNPTAVAELNEGETVLDLGSGGGLDVLLSAQRVGPSGQAYGLDMTDEMLELARENQRKAGVENVEWRKGTIEDIPLPGDSVDVIISNCVINLSADKPAVFREAARVLRPGGRFAVTDVVADPDMDEDTRRDMQRWTGCIAGALTLDDFERELVAAGLEASKSAKLTASTNTPARRSFARGSRNPALGRQRRSKRRLPGLGAEVQVRVLRWLDPLDPRPAQPQLLAAAHELAAHREPVVAPVGGCVGVYGLDGDTDRHGVGDAAIDVEAG